MEDETKFQKTITDEQFVRNILERKIKALKSYSDIDSKILAYRLAEIFVLAKNLYTDLLQDLNQANESDEKEVWEKMMGIRMHLLHLRDCIEDFDQGLLDLMEDKEEEDEKA